MQERLQDELEYETASYVTQILGQAIRLIGETGVDQAETSVEVNASIKNAYAAVLRWELEKRLDTGRFSIGS